MPTLIRLNGIAPPTASPKCGKWSDFPESVYQSWPLVWFCQHTIDRYNTHNLTMSDRPSECRYGTKETTFFSKFHCLKNEVTKTHNANARHRQLNFKFIQCVERICRGVSESFFPIGLNGVFVCAIVIKEGRI